MGAELVRKDLDLHDHELEAIAKLVHTTAGICLDESKRELVRGRLTKRLRALEMTDFSAYLAHLRHDKAEFTGFLDALTTNKTSFFREKPHFDRLRDELVATRAKQVRIWSAGCSSGEEPYTMAMVATDAGLSGAKDCRILATDLSSRVLDLAKAATYDESIVAEVPEPQKRRFFTKVKTLDGGARFAVVPALQAMIRFARLNLMGDWPMQGPFDAIFCRNVMIYFDAPTREWLVTRYRSLLRPGGLLVIGMSETLAGARNQFQFVQPGVYRNGT